MTHQHEFAAHCVTPVGDRAMLEGAAALALTAPAVAADVDHLQLRLALGRLVIV